MLGASDKCDCYGDLRCAGVPDDDDEEEEAAPKTKTVKETVWDWDLLNENKALWLRNPSDVTEEEHEKFFKALAKVPPPPRPPAPPRCSARLCWAAF
jgi:hypothetical protein